MIQPYAIPGLKYRPILDRRLVKQGNIERAVCEVIGVTVRDLSKRSRKADFVRARHYVFYFLRTLTSLELSTIGKMYNRDHTSVMHAVKKIQDFLTVDQITITEIEKIEEKIAYDLQGL